MSLASLTVCLLLFGIMIYIVMSHDKIVNELKEIRTKCIKIHNLKNTCKDEVKSEVESENEGFIDSTNPYYIRAWDRGYSWKKKKKSYK